MIEEQPESNEQFQVIQMTDVSTTSDLTIPMQDLDSQPHTIIQIQAPMVTHNAYTYTPIDRQNPNIQTIHLRYSSWFILDLQSKLLIVRFYVVLEKNVFPS